MSDFRKYVKLIETYERIDETKRKEAVREVRNYAYRIAIHLVKLYHLPTNLAREHWVVEIYNFTNSIINKTSKASIKQDTIFQELTRDVLTIQLRNKMITQIHEEYGYITIDSDDIYTFLYDRMKRLSILIDKGVLVNYDDIWEILE